MNTPTCPTCNDHGRISNGCDPNNPGYDDGPCPEPDCDEGAAERDSAWLVREAESNVHPLFAEILAPFAPRRAA